MTNSSSDHEEGPFYVEFVSCAKGNDYSQTNLSNMIESWRMLPISEDLRGSYLYDPIKEENAFGPSLCFSTKSVNIEQNSGCIIV